jgi:hypothetical protein
MADTGFLTSGTIASGGSGPTAWTNPNNASTSNNSYASQSIFTPSFANTATLTFTNFGAAVPSGATIDGIEITIERNAATAGRIKDLQVQLVKGGTASGTDKADTSTTYGTTDSTITYGGASDLWGNTLTQSDVNATNFGIVFRATTNSSTITSCNVDAIRLKIYYTASGGTTVSVTNGTVVYSGKTVAIKKTKVIPVSQGTVTYTGQAVTIRRNRWVAVQHATIAGVGRSVGVIRHRVVPITHGIVSLAGQSVGITTSSGGVTVTVTHGAISYVGQTVSIKRSRKVSVSVAVENTQGQAVNIRRTRKVPVTLATETLIGKSVGITRQRKVSISPANIASSGQTVSVKTNKRIAVTYSSFSVTGKTVAIRRSGITDTIITVTHGIIHYVGGSVDIIRGIYNHEEEVCREVFDVATVTGICNRALALVGMSAISSLVENTTEARACETFYNQTRRSLMQAVPWGFLRIQRSLALLGAAAGTPENFEGTGTVSEYGWLYTYAYPCDCLEATMILPSSDGVIASQFSNTGAMRDSQNSIVPFVQGTWANPSGGYKRVISTNKQNAILIYQGNITDPSVYPDDFVTLIETTIAAQLATQQGLTNASYYVQQAANSLAQLKAKYAIEYNTDRKPLVYDPVSEFISVRG